MSRARGATSASKTSPTGSRWRRPTPSTPCCSTSSPKPAPACRPTLRQPARRPNRQSTCRPTLWQELLLDLSDYTVVDRDPEGVPVEPVVGLVRLERLEVGGRADEVDRLARRPVVVLRV